MTAVLDEQFDEKVEDINTLYRQAPELAQKGERVLSTDELSGVQALERKHPKLPMGPGKVERQEFEYTRHGTQCFIINFEVATGQIEKPSYGYTRTEEDFVNHIQRTVESDLSVIVGILSSTISTSISRSPWCATSLTNRTSQPTWASRARAAS